jgi:hypothetical protein
MLLEVLAPLALVGWVIVVRPTASGEPITWEWFDRIHLGMPRAEVEALLGGRG